MIWEWDICGLNGWEIYDKWVTQLWQSQVFLRGYAQKMNTLSSHRMTTGFSPFELLTCGLQQKGWNCSPLKAFFEDPRSWLVFTVLRICK